jgi:hypothetical protein
MSLLVSEKKKLVNREVFSLYVSCKEDIHNKCKCNSSGFSVPLARILEGGYLNGGPSPPLPTNNGMVPQKKTGLRPQQSILKHCFYD